MLAEATVNRRSGIVSSGLGYLGYVAGVSPSLLEKQRNPQGPEGTRPGDRITHAHSPCQMLARRRWPGVLRCVTWAGRCLSVGR